MNQGLHQRSFQSLSLRDALEARNTYHVHLTNMENVVATAIGRFRFRRQELRDMPMDGLHPHGPSRSSKRKEPRTLMNSYAPRWAPACVLVFVREWLSREDFLTRPDQIVPEYLYLPDGRVVPTCVVQVQMQPRAPAPTVTPSFSSCLVGGGYSVLTESQGREHLGSIGCLVTDGNSVFALTNRHVVGAPGTELYTLVNGQRMRLGVADERRIGKLPFEELYDGWPGTRAFVNLDAGLIRIDDLQHWTTQVYGIGEIGELADLHPANLTLDVIGRQVCAYGAASQRLEGEILALFYRYKSLGGYDYVSDLLIGGQEGKPMQTLPGDSGTLWLLEEADEAEPVAKGRKPQEGKPRLRPIALQWGGHVMLDPGSSGKSEFHYALGTSLSNICRLLEVDLVRDWNLGHVEYWGEMGHYTIGAKACDLVSDPKLKKLMAANRDRVGFNEDILRDPAQYKRGSNHYDFVPLADVADDVWRLTPARQKDESNHFADMDEPGQGKFEGMDLLELSKQPENVYPRIWNEFYDAIGADKKGSLPFRVWQIYEEMVQFARAGDAASFVAAAGILAHYVGDACQPLHVSRFHHGIPPVKKGTVQYNVHSVYETQMLDQKAAEILEGIAHRLKGVKAEADVKGGHGAAVAVIGLMRSTIESMPPEELVQTYNEGTGPKDRIERLWSGFGDRTLDAMAAGALRLASIWESAWAEGQGAQSVQDLGAIGEDVLRQLYQRTSFLKSLTLEEMIAVLGEAPATPEETPPAEVRRRRSTPQRASRPAASSPRRTLTGRRRARSHRT